MSLNQSLLYQSGVVLSYVPTYWITYLFIEEEVHDPNSPLIG